MSDQIRELLIGIIVLGIMPTVIASVLDFRDWVRDRRVTRRGGGE